jgi:glutamate racemase
MAPVQLREQIGEVRKLTSVNFVVNLFVPNEFNCDGRKKVLVLATNLTLREEEVVPYLKEKLSSFELEQYDTVVLGCTHFPYFKNSIKKMFPEDVNIISGSIGTANNLRRILEATNQINDGIGEIIFFKSGYKVEDKDILSNYKKLLLMLDELLLIHLNLKQ